MGITLSSPVTGAAQTGFTSPTYTVEDMAAPTHFQTQYAVTALGGTQTGATAHSVSSPFTVTFERPRALKVLGLPNPNGFYAQVPVNTYKVRTRKGVTPAADQPDRIAPIVTEIGVPAGADSYDAAELRAALSLHIGSLEQLSADIGDGLVTGLW